MTLFTSLRDVFDQDAEFLWHKDHDLRGADCIILPGGFFVWRLSAVRRHRPLFSPHAGSEGIRRRGGIVLGICNGFQVLLELGLLPGAMLRNKDLKFLCQHVYVRIDNAATPFTRAGAGRAGFAHPHRSF